MFGYIHEWRKKNSLIKWLEKIRDRQKEEALRWKLPEQG